MNITAATVSRLSLQPGDALVLQVDTILSEQHHQRVQDLIKPHIPAGVPVLVLDRSTKLAVLEPTTHLFSDRDADEVRREAARLIWHSMRKFNGHPTHIDYHPLACVCTECN